MGGDRIWRAGSGGGAAAGKRRENGERGRREAKMFKNFLFLFYKKEREKINYFFLKPNNL